MPPNGMRFWLPAVLNVPGQNKRLADKPFVEGAAIASRLYPNIKYKGEELFIRGERFIDDPNIVKKLVAKPGNLRFDAQDALDLGYMSLSELEELGFSGLVDKGVEVKKEKPNKKDKKKKSLPDFDVMTKDELVEFAGKNKLNVDVRLNKPELLEEIKELTKE